MKFFFVSFSGGIFFFKVILSVFSDVFFCFIGGINGDNVNEYFLFGNVRVVGGIWMMLKVVIEVKNW